MLSVKIKPSKMDRMKSANNQLGKDYLNHKVFKRLREYSKFYDQLGFGVMGFITTGTGSVINIDTYVYSSMQGTIDSMWSVLRKGQIGDAYSLLRKYYDSTIINIYTNLIIEDNFDIEDPSTFKNAAIDGWLKGGKQLPEYRVMSQYVKASTRLKPITDLLAKDSRYKGVRDRCNDHTHYNFYRHVLLNDGQIHQERIISLDNFLHDLDQIFIQHFAYLFYLNGHYMMSSDYADAMDVGYPPEEGSQYFVAPYVQTVFNKFLKLKRPDLAKELIDSTSMELE